MAERNCGHGHVFDDPKVKEQMLNFRLEGYSYTDIARRYDVDHTTIMYHCRKAGIAPAGIMVELPDGQTVLQKYKLPRLEEPAPRPPRPPKPLTLAQIRDARPKRPGWRQDEKGEWICIGLSIKGHRDLLKKRHREEVEQLRVSLLIY